MHQHTLVEQGLARWYHGRLIPVMRGGDGRDEPLFTLPPDDLTEIEDADLAELAAGLRARVKEVFKGQRDPEIVSDRTMPEVEGETEQAVLAILRIDAELAARASQDDSFESNMSELASRAGVTEEEEGEPETEAVEETPAEEEATVASATAAPETPAATAPAAAPAQQERRALPAVRRHRPVQTSDDGTGLRVTNHAASLGSSMVNALDVLDRRTLGIFLADLVRRNRIQPGQKAVIAHATFAFEKERMLEDGPEGYLVNSERIRDALPGALVASGENCAPLPPRYELPGVETPTRPVRGALESFQAVRGGVQVGVTPKMGDYEDAVGVVTSAENAAGGTTAVKNCMRIECPDFNPVAVDSIYHCTEADNLGAKAYPELMSRIADLVMAEQARLADSKLLSAIKAGSVKVTFGDNIPGGAWFYFAAALAQAGAAIRSRNRMPRDARIQGLLPAWIIDLLLTDSLRAAAQDGRPTTRAAIEAAISGLGVDATYYLDGPSDGVGQIFTTQSPGVLQPFPTAAQIALYPPASWLHLDAGELQLGVVRDSSLNSTNDFQTFGETWENVAFVGVESLWATVTVCPSGTFAGGIDLSDACGT